MLQFGYFLLGTSQLLIVLHSRHLPQGDLHWEGGGGFVIQNEVIILLMQTFLRLLTSSYEIC